MKKRNIMIPLVAVIITIFLGGTFLLYSSYIKMQELQAKIKIEEEKTKQELIKNQNNQQNSQEAGSKERVLASAFTSSKKGTSYEAELMDRMSSFPEDDYQRADEVFEAWDKELNKIYKLLMSELSQNEKIELRNEEREWLKQRERKVNSATEGGTGMGFRIAYYSIMTEWTANRAIELARRYDNLK